jgi:hypothetical protein
LCLTQSGAQPGFPGQSLPGDSVSHLLRFEAAGKCGVRVEAASGTGTGIGLATTTGRTQSKLDEAVKQIGSNVTENFKGAVMIAVHHPPYAFGKIGGRIAE